MSGTSVEIYSTTSVVELDKEATAELFADAITVVEATTQGPPGPAGDLHYTHTQGVAAATWSITHSLGKHPSITVIDSGGDEVIPAIAYPSPNAVTLTFSGAVSGVAYLN